MRRPLKCRSSFASSSCPRYVGRPCIRHELHIISVIGSRSIWRVTRVTANFCILRLHICIAHNLPTFTAPKEAFQKLNFCKLWLYITGKFHRNLHTIFPQKIGIWSPIEFLWSSITILWNVICQFSMEKSYGDFYGFFTKVFHITIKHDFAIAYIWHIFKIEGML
jgi:hypothetical protein